MKKGQTIELDGITVKAFNAFVGGSIFTATFVKKDNSIRVMNCRREVKKHLAGGECSWNPEERGFVSVFDLHSKGYRVINLATLIELKANGAVMTNTAMSANAIEKQIADLTKQLEGIREMSPIEKVFAESDETDTSVMSKVNAIIAQDVAENGEKMIRRLASKADALLDAGFTGRGTFDMNGNTP